jgi:hypothetical protein
MAGQRVRSGIRTAFAMCGLALVATGVLTTLQGGSELTSLGALLTGVLLIVIGGTGRIPEEIGLQRIKFDHPTTDASAYQQALYEAVCNELPHLHPPVPAPYGHSSQSIWMEELQLHILVTWAPDESCRFDVSLVEPAIEQTPSSVAVILVTNIDDIEDVRRSLRSRHGDRTAVVRWQSHHDNEALRRAAHRLSNVLALRHRQRSHGHGPRR